jgi:cation transporter-like permease
VPKSGPFKNEGIHEAVSNSLQLIFDKYTIRYGVVLCSYTSAFGNYVNFSILVPRVIQNEGKAASV